MPRCSCCKDAGKVHRRDCPRWVGGNTCTCIPAPSSCVLCQEDRRNRRIAFMLVAAIVLVALIVFLRRPPSWFPF